MYLYIKYQRIAFLLKKREKMGFKDFAIGIGKGAAGTAANGLVGMGLSALGDLFGIGNKKYGETTPV